MLENLYYIIEGWVKWLFSLLKGTDDDEVSKRLEICNKCKQNKIGVCKKCGCVIGAKVQVNYFKDKEGKSINGCPLRKW